MRLQTWGKARLGAPSSFELAPAPSPSPSTIKSQNGQDAGDAAKPAPLPAGSVPGQPPANPSGQSPANDSGQPPPAAGVPLDSLLPPAPTAADSSSAPARVNPPGASGQATDAGAPPPVEPAPVITAPGLAAIEPPSSPAPAPSRDKVTSTSPPGGSPMSESGTGKSNQGEKAGQAKPETTSDQGHPGASDLQAKPRIDDKPEPGPILASPPIGDVNSETRSTPSSAAAPGSVPHDAHQGDAEHKPKPNQAPEPSPALAPRTAEEPANSKPKAAEAQMLEPSSTADSAIAHDTAAKRGVGNSRPEDVPRALSSRADSQPESSTPAVAEIARPGWVSIRNSGKVPLAAGDEVDARSADADDKAAGSDLTRDAHAHAAKEMEFELESPRSRATARDPGTSRALQTDAQAGSTAGARRVETVPHVVEKNENFWTISRQYYGSGRYYRALWKANAERCPQIDGLHVNDVIIIPPAEDLDPAEIESPGEHTRSVRTGRGTPGSGTPAARSRRKAGEPDASDSGTDSILPGASEVPPARRRTAGTGARTNQLSNTDDAIPIQRSSRTSNELELPAAGSESIFTRDRRSAERRADLTASEGDDDESDVRSARRPRSANDDENRARETRPVYKVRPNDTLRSIARDTLGTARRADEILELNREKIDDPSNLVVGQILELPDDARSSIRRAANR